MYFLIGLISFFVLPELVGGKEPASDVSCSTNGWCTSDAFDIFWAKSLVAPNCDAAALWSHIINFCFCPIIAFLSTFSPFWQRGDKHHAGQDSVLLVGTCFFAISVNTMVKIIAKRQRPCFFYGVQAGSEAADKPNEEYLSFFSGDATIACAFASTGLCLAKIRQRKYASTEHAYALRIPIGEYLHSLFKTHSTSIGISPLAYLGWFVALVGSFMRIAAYMHWMTDVMVGILWGGMTGYLPLFVFQLSAHAETLQAGVSDMNSAVSSI